MLIEPENRLLVQTRIVVRDGPLMPLVMDKPPALVVLVFPETADDALLLLAFPTLMIQMPGTVKRRNNLIPAHGGTLRELMGPGQFKNNLFKHVQLSSIVDFKTNPTSRTMP